jgi:hypothetical protein
MTFMTKNYTLVLALVFLSSCNYLSYADIIPLAKRAAFGVDDIKIDDNFLSQQKYSFIKVNVGRTGVAILTLASIKDGIYTWVSGTGEKLQTYNGKIIKSFDIIYDTHFITFSDFSFNKNFENAEYDYNIRLFNPNTLVTQEATLKTIDITPLENKDIYFEEFVTTRGFKWKFVNKYWLNNDGYVTKSIQHIHPMLPKYEIKFYYK